MSAQTMSEVWAAVDAHYYAEVLKATWGHLAPHKNKTYRGHIIFALGCFGSDYLNPTVLACDLGIEDSPWFFEAMTEFLQNLGGEAGVYRWDGSFRNYIFRGKLQRLNLRDQG